MGEATGRCMCAVGRVREAEALCGVLGLKGSWASEWNVTRALGECGLHRHLEILGVCAVFSRMHLVEVTEVIPIKKKRGPCTRSWNTPMRRRWRDAGYPAKETEK